MALSIFLVPRCFVWVARVQAAGSGRGRWGGANQAVKGDIKPAMDAPRRAKYMMDAGFRHPS
jgi:hypothetical protein